MIEAIKFGASDAQIDYLLADRLHRELAIALDNEVGVELTATEVVDLSCAWLPGRSVTARPVFRSSRTNNDDDGILAGNIRKSSTKGHLEAALLKHTSVLKQLISRRVISDRSEQCA